MSDSMWLCVYLHGCVRVCARAAINNEVYPMACLMARSMLMARGSDTHALTLKASKHSPKGGEGLLFCTRSFLLLSVLLLATSPAHYLSKPRSLAFSCDPAAGNVSHPTVAADSGSDVVCLVECVALSILSKPNACRQGGGKKKKKDFVCGLRCHFNHPPSSLVECVVSDVQY